MNSTHPTKRFPLRAVLAAIVLLTSPAFAQTPTLRFEHAPIRPNYLPYWALESSRGGNFDLQTLTSFTFPSDEKIHEFRWRGAFLNSGTLTPTKRHNPPATNAGQWEVTVWADDNGSPAPAPIITYTVPASEVTRTETTEENFWTGIFTFHEHSFQFPTPFEATAGTRYWISPVYRGNTAFPLFLLDSGATGQIPVPQMAWASVRRPLGNTLVRVHHDGGRTLSDDIWEYRETQATIKLITLPSSDADNDGMDDDWESTHGLDTSSDDSLEDPDADGSNNLDEFARNTDPQNDDTDGDGLLDGVETNSGTYLDSSDTGTSPVLTDSDRDGLGDALEIPTATFTGIEQPGTDPNQRDTDGDGYADKLEIDQGLDPTEGSSLPSLIVLTGLIGNDLTDPEDDGTAAGDSAAGIIFDHEENSQTLASERHGSFMDLFDNTTTGSNSYWMTRANYRVDVALDSPHALDSFTLTSGITSRTRDPLSWEIQGSNDGQNFETIFHRSNSVESVWTGNSQTVRFDAGVHYVSPPAFTTYRLRLYEYQDQPEFDTIELGELELFGTEAVITVTNTGNSGPGSLRQAISDSLTNGTIVFDPSLAGSTIGLEGESLVFERNLTIDASSLLEPITILGGGAEAVISVSENCDVNLDSLIISGGGRGVENAGSLTMTRVKVTENELGGIRNEGTLLLSSCLVASNRDVFSAGIDNNGILTAEYTTIANNRKLPGNFAGVTPAENRNSGTFILNHSTLVAPSGGGSNQLSNIGTLRITNSTVYGRIVNRRLPGRSGVLTIANSIHRGFISSSSADIVATGHNLISHLNGSGLTEGPGIIVADPRLAPLGDYGGPTPTMPPLPGSPAIDVFDDPQEVTTDQRGFPRLVASGYDLGAAEYQGDPDFARFFHVDYDQDGNSLGIEQALGTDPFTPDQNHPNNLGTPVFNGEAQPVLTFGLNTAAHPNTTWILERSSDLVIFEEIYSFDGTTDFAIEGIPIEVNRTGEKVTVTDEAPPATGAYYRFRARLKNE